MLKYYGFMIEELIGSERFADFAESFFKRYFDGNPFWIWGGSKEGRICYDLITAAGFTVKGFIDNNADRMGDECVRPDMVVFEEPFNLIIASQKAEREIDAQLRGMNIKNVSVYSYGEIMTHLVRAYLIGMGMLDDANTLQIDKKTNLYYWGDYASWDEAVNDAKNDGKIVGYSSDLIYDATIKNYEHISSYYSDNETIWFNGPDYYECLSAILYVLQKLDHVNLMDFGGSLGNLYYKYMKILDMTKIKWNIVEQDEYVEFGKNNIEGICFWKSVEECIANEKIDCILMSSSLQYLDSTEKWLDRILSCNARYLIIDRTPILRNTKSTIVNQNVPERIYSAVYPLWLLNRDTLINTLGSYSYESYLNGDWTNLLNGEKEENNRSIMDFYLRRNPGTEYIYIKRIGP